MSTSRDLMKPDHLHMCEDETVSDSERGHPVGHGPDLADHDHQHHHDHDHEHVHDTSALSRLQHAVSGLFGGHSHDAAEQIDEALEADAEGRRALMISLVGLAATAGVQIVV